MRRFVVVRTDKSRRDFIRTELEAGRLRQGWGSKRDHDLRVLRQRRADGTKLSDEEASVWRNRRLLDTEPDGLKPGDFAIVPNIPEQGRWVIARVTGPYRFDLPDAVAGVGVDYGHVVPVELVRGKDGRPGIVEADNENVDARLRASMRNLSRMWSVDAVGDAIERLVHAIETGADTVSLSFQNLAKAEARVTTLFGLSMSGAVLTTEWNKALVAFQKRHLLAHSMGIVDDAYLAATNDTSVPKGRKVRISAQEVREVLGVLRTVATMLRAALG